MPPAADRARTLLTNAIRLRAAGDLAAAARLIGEALALQPENTDALHLAGVVAHQRGQSARGLELVERALGLRPDRIVFHRSRGIIAAALGKRDVAIDALKLVWEETRGDVALARDLAALLVAAGRQPEAADILVGASEAADDPECWFESGVLLQNVERRDAAIDAYRRSIARNPAHARALNNLAMLLAAQGASDEAHAAFDRALAIALTPADGAVLATNYANFLVKHADKKDARRFYETAVHLMPEVPAYRFNLASYLDLWSQAGEPMASSWHGARGVELRPEAIDDVDAPDLPNRLMSLLHADADGLRHCRAARRWAGSLARLDTPEHSRRDESPGRQLRVGYCSSDFRFHSVANFLLPILAQHDRTRYEIFAYANVQRPDAVTERIRSICTGWVDATRLGDAELAARIVADRIDILVDLNGHTPGERLEVFRRRPAPLQLTWLGFPGTTGLGCFDARITDAWADPPGLTDAHFTEKLERLARGFLAYRPIIDPPVHAPLPPSSTADVMTFGCFNNAAKIGKSALALWAQTLAAVPNARLVLKAHQLEDRLVADDLRRLVREAGIRADKVDLLPPVGAYTQHLRAYDGIDIALDSFPYHGTTTTCEALLMGVPVVTLAGTTHASRVGVSLLTRLGRPEFVADNEADFIAICRKLASDAKGLEELRRGLRTQLLSSALYDAASVTRDLEALFRRLWRRSCSASP